MDYIKKYLEQHNIKSLINYLKQAQYRNGNIKNNEIYYQLLSNTQHIQTNNIAQRLYLFLNNIKEIPKCQFCTNNLKFRSFKVGYSKVCSKKCAVLYHTKYHAKQIYNHNYDKILFGIKNMYKDDNKRILANVKRRTTCLQKYNSNNGMTHQKNSQIVKNGYTKISQELNDIKKLYSKEQVSRLLNSEQYFYKQYFGKGNFRKLIAIQKVLYKSIIEYTNQYKQYIKHFNFSARLLIAAQNFNISQNRCLCGKHILYNPYIPALQKNLTMSCCHNGGFSPSYFKIKYGQEWEQHYINAVAARHKKANETIELNGNNSISKISKEFFQILYTKLKNKNNIYTGFLNKEYLVYLTKQDRQLLKKHNLVQACFYLDFWQNNKVIQFNGSYWHKNLTQKDNLRKIILQQHHNMQVLYIDQIEYYHNKQDIINQCITFLQGDNI